MGKKRRKQIQKQSDPDIREVKLILLFCFIAFTGYFIVFPVLSAPAVPLQFILPQAFAEDQNIIMLGDTNNPRQGGTGSACPTITGPASATDFGGSALTHWRDTDARGCEVVTWTLDRTTTTQKLIPNFFNDFLTAFGLIHDPTGGLGTFTSACRFYEVSEQGVDPRLNITAAYEVVDGRNQNIGGSMNACSNSGTAPDFVSSGTANYLDSMALNSSFFSFGVNSLTDDRAVAFDNTITAGGFLKFTFTNPTALNNTVWMMQEHPKFPSSTIDGGFFGIDSGPTIFTMDSNTLDDTDIGQVVAFREFNKTTLGGAGFNTTTATFLQDRNVNAEDTDPHDVFFSPNGTKMYVLGNDGDDINEYTLSTAWDTSTETFIQSYSHAAQTTAGTGFFFKPDGLRMYVITSAGGGDIHEYTVSNPFDLGSTIAFVQTGDITDSSVQDGFFRADGLKFYAVDGIDLEVREYDLSVAWDVSTLSFNQALDVSTSATFTQDVFFQPNGLRMFIADDSATTSDIETWNLSTAWDISSATHIQSFDVQPDGTTLPEGVFFRDDGLKMYVVDSATARVYEYDLEISELDQSNLQGIRVVGGMQSLTSAIDQSIRIEVKDGSYGTGTLDSFPLDKYDIYQGGGSLGVVHLTPSTTVEPFDVSFLPNWSNSTQDTVTVFIGVDDNSAGGSTILNITSVEWDSNIKYNFKDINSLDFYETTIEKVVGGLEFDDIRPGANDYDMGILNITTANPVGFTASALPAPSAVTALTLELSHFDEIKVDWSHDMLNVTKFKIERDDGTGFVEIVTLIDPQTTVFTDAEQLIPSRAIENVLSDAVGLEPNTTYTYRVTALNGDVAATSVTSSPLTTPDDIDYWELKEHDAETFATVGIADFTTDGGDTGDWFRMKALLTSDGRNSEFLIKSFNMTDLGVTDETDLIFHHENQCLDATDCPGAMRWVIFPGEYHRYNSTFFPSDGTPDPVFNPASGTNWGGSGLGGIMGAGLVFEDASERVSIDWDSMKAVSDFATMYWTWDDSSFNNAAVDFANITLSNVTTWNFRLANVNYTSDTTNCKLQDPAVPPFKTSADDCDSGSVFTPSTSHLETKQTQATDDWQYRERDDDSPGGNVPLIDFGINATGFFMNFTQAVATNDRPNEGGHGLLFKTFTPTSATTLIESVVESEINVETGGIVVELKVCDESLDRWNGTQFETQIANEICTVIDSGTGLTVPFAESTISFSADTSTVIGEEVTAVFRVRDFSASDDGSVLFKSATIGDTTYDFSSPTIKTEVENTRGGDRGLISPSSTINTFQAWSVIEIPRDGTPEGSAICVPSLSGTDLEVDVDLEGNCFMFKSVPKSEVEDEDLFIDWEHVPVDFGTTTNTDIEFKIIDGACDRLNATQFAFNNFGCAPDGSNDLELFDFDQNDFAFDHQHWIRANEIDYSISTEDFVTLQLRIESIGLGRDGSFFPREIWWGDYGFWNFTSSTIDYTDTGIHTDNGTIAPSLFGTPQQIDPPILTVTEDGADLLLTWEDGTDLNSDDMPILHYEIDRKIFPESSFSTIINNTIDCGVSSFCDAGPLSYPLDTIVDYERIYDFGTGLRTTFTDQSEKQSGFTATYKARAFTTAGLTSDSNEDSATTILSTTGFNTTDITVGNGRNPSFTGFSTQTGSTDQSNCYDQPLTTTRPAGDLNFWVDAPSYSKSATPINFIDIRILRAVNTAQCSLPAYDWEFDDIGLPEGSVATDIDFIRFDGGDQSGAVLPKTRVNINDSPNFGGVEWHYMNNSADYYINGAGTAFEMWKDLTGIGGSRNRDLVLFTDNGTTNYAFNDNMASLINLTVSANGDTHYDELFDVAVSEFNRKLKDPTIDEFTLGLMPSNYEERLGFSGLLTYFGEETGLSSNTIRYGSNDGSSGGNNFLIKVDYTDPREWGLREHDTSSTGDPDINFTSGSTVINSTSTSVGEGYIFKTFPTEDIEDKRIRINWEGIGAGTNTFLEVLDGRYDKNNATDFPSEAPRPLKGGGVIGNLTSPAHPFSAVTNEITLDWSLSALNETTVFVHLTDSDMSGSFETMLNTIEIGGFALINFTSPQIFYNSTIALNDTGNILVESQASIAEPPFNLTATADLDTVDLAWEINDTSDVDGFDIFRNDTLLTAIGNAQGWNTNTRVFNDAFSVITKQPNPRDLFIGKDGSRLYTIGDTEDEVNQWNLSTDFDITTATFVTQKSVSAQETAPNGLFFKSDGTKMFIVGTIGDTVYEYDLSTAWEISSATFNSNTLSVSQDPVPLGLFFRDDGKKLYVAGNSGGEINEYDLTTPWDVSSGSFLRSTDVAIAGIRGLSIEENGPNAGERILVADAGMDQIDQYLMSDPWNVTSATFLASISINSEENAIEGIFMKQDDGSKMYITGVISQIISAKDVNEYDITTSGSTTSYTDFSVDLGTNYEYKIRSDGFKGNSTNATSNVVLTNDVPAQVQGLSSEFVNAVDIDSQWTSLAFNSGEGSPSTGLNLTRYDIFRQNQTAGEDFVLAGQNFATSPPVNFFNDTVTVPFPNVYNYQVSGCNELGCGTNSTVASATVTVVPDPVVNMSATAVNATVSLNWDDALFAINYTVTRGILNASHIIIAQGVPTSDYIDTTPATNTNYTYSAWAVNNNGNGTTGFSNSVITNDLPTAPQNLTGAMGLVIPDLEDVFLDWEHPLDNGTGSPSTGVDIIHYQVERKQGLGAFAFLANTTNATPSYEDETVLSGANYTYQVRGVNAVGFSPFSNTFSIITTPLMTPNAPTALNATTISGTEIDLEWIAPIGIDQPTDYVIQRRHVGFTGFSTIDTISATFTTFSDSGLLSGNTYDYQVAGSNGAGQGPYSNIAQNTTFTVPSAPLNLIANTLNDTAIFLDWDEPAQTNGGIENYTLDIESPIGGGFGFLATVNGNITNFTSTGLTTKTEYNYQVNATNLVGTGQYSNEAANTTFGVPGPPINLGFVTNGVSEITVDWDAPVNDFGSAITGYRIDQAEGVGGTFITAIADTGNNVEPLEETFIGLLQQTNYIYRIAGINGFGLGDFSANLTAGTFSGPSAPENFFVVFNATKPYSTFLSWETPLNDGGQPIVGYLVERKDTGGVFQLIANLTSPSILNFTDTSLLNLAQHEYRVAAYSNPTGSFTPSQPVTTFVPANIVNFTINDFEVVGDVLRQDYSFVVDDCFPICTLTQADIERNGITEANWVLSEAVTLDAGLNFTTYFIIPTSGTQLINTTAIVTNLGGQGDDEVGVVTTQLQFVTDVLFFNHTRINDFEDISFNLTRKPIPWDASCTHTIGSTLSPVQLGISGTQTVFGSGNGTFSGIGFVSEILNANPSVNSYVACFDPPGTQILAFTSFGTGNGTLALTAFTDQLGDFMGVPVPFIFILLFAAIWTGRSASTGIIFLAVAIGSMGVLGYFDPLSGSPTEGSLAGFWGMIVLLTLVGVFIGKRFF